MTKSNRTYSIKISIVLGLSALAVAVAFLTLPIKQWKKYKENHPSLFEVNDKATPKYWDFCLSYWKTFFIMDTEKEEDITYDGGELKEFTVIASKI